MKENDEESGDDGQDEDGQDEDGQDEDGQGEEEALRSAEESAQNLDLIALYNKVKDLVFGPDKLQLFLKGNAKSGFRYTLNTGYPLENINKYFVPVKKSAEGSFLPVQHADIYAFDIANLLLQINMPSTVKTELILKMISSKVGGEEALRAELNQHLDVRDLQRITHLNLTAYSSTSTVAGLRTVQNEFIDYIIYLISSDALFGIRSRSNVRRDGSIEYFIQLKLDAFGIKDNQTVQSVNDKLGFDTEEEVSFVFIPAAPRKNQPGYKVKDWNTAAKKRYRVVSQRRGRDKVQDEQLWSMVWIKRYMLFHFARESGLSVEYYSETKPNSCFYLWRWEELVLLFMDGYRNFACHRLSKRKKLYGLLMWTTVTWTYFPQFKMLLLNCKAFGVPNTQHILEYCFRSDAARKVNRESMTTIMDEEYLRHLRKLASNLCLPLTRVGQDSFSLYLVVTGRVTPVNLVLLFVRCVVRVLLTRVNTVELMTWNNFFNPMNGPEAWSSGQFTFGHELCKTTYAQGSSQHQGLGTHNHAVYVDFTRPWMCPISTFVLLLGQLLSAPRSMLSRETIDPNERMLDALCKIGNINRPRAPHRKTKSRSGEKLKRTANNSRLNKLQAVRFKNASTFPAQDFFKNGYLEDPKLIACSEQLKEDIVGSDHHMTIYGEKKAGADELMRRSGVRLDQVESRAYGNKTAKEVNEKRKSRSITNYITPELLRDDRKLAKILSGNDMQIHSEHPPTAWEYLKKHTAETVVKKVGDALMGKAWRGHLASHKDALALVAIGIACRYGSRKHIGESTALLTLEVWRDAEVVHSVTALRSTLEDILELQESGVRLSVNRSGAVVEEEVLRTERVLVSAPDFIKANRKNLLEDELKLMLEKDLAACEREQLEEEAKLNALIEKTRRRMCEKMDTVKRSYQEYKMRQGVEEIGGMNAVVEKSKEELFIEKFKFIEKGTGDAKKNKIVLNQSTYQLVLSLNKSMRGSSKPDNFSKEKQSTAALSQQLVRHAEAWFDGIQSLPAVMTLPKSFTTVMLKQAADDFAAVKKALKTDALSTIPSHLVHLVNVNNNKKTTHSNVYLTFVDNIKHSERVAKLCFLVFRNQERPLDLNMAATDVIGYVQKRALLMKASPVWSPQSKANKSQEKFSEAFSHFTDEDWEVRTFSQCVVSGNVKKKIYFWKLLSEGAATKKVLDEWVCPRPKAATRTRRRNAENRA